MKRFTNEQLSEVGEILKSGGVIVFPTETAYGIGCDATNHDAVKRVFEIKERPNEKGTPLIAANIEMAQEYVQCIHDTEDIMRRFWPGALNLVLPLTERGEELLSPRCSQGGLQAIRVSSHEVALGLSKELGKPIVATSANISGKDACYSAEDVLTQLKDQQEQPDGIVDVGILCETPVSTIVKICSEGAIVLRQGDIKL